jgi:hypothetical protein
MVHELHLRINIDLDRPAAEVIVNGHLTPDGVKELVPVLRRTLGVVACGVVVNLNPASHIEPDALDLLRGIAPYIGTPHEPDHQRILIEYDGGRAAAGQRN